MIKRDIDGILLLDKPLSLSSNTALQIVKRLYQAKKAGHTGSLDPLATGMLPICLGEATKYAQFLLDAHKSYRVTAQLGATTTTGDAEGEVLAQCAVPSLERAAVEKLLQSFLGETTQIPPMYSALKHQGRPLYQLARQGIEIERASRLIYIDQLVLENLTSDTLTLTVHCSKGTYIRTLIADIGERLHCGAHVSALRRLSVADFKTMYTVTTLEDLTTEARDALLLPVDQALTHFPIYACTPEEAKALWQGKSILGVSQEVKGELLRLYHADSFMGLGERQGDYIVARRLMRSG